MSIDWQKLYQCRYDIATRFGDIWSVPIRKRYHQVVSDVGGQGTSLLEIGAGDRAFKTKMAGYWGEFDYVSCDIDPTYDHNFQHIDQVTGQFDVICAFELIEHLSLEEAVHMVEQMFSVTRSGGHVALTTPNIFYPPAFMRDATHRTAFCYDELGGLLELAGFRVTAIYRLYHDSLIKKLLRRVVFYPLFRLIGIDFAKQIIVIAEKPA